VNVGGNATITGIASFGLQAYDSGVGNISVTTGDGDIINGGSDGILVTNSSKSSTAGHTITVNVGADTVHSNTRFGINVGYNPANAGVVKDPVTGNAFLTGDVFLTSNATVTAVNNAVNGFNWGTGNVTVVTGTASSETSSGGSGIFAGAFDGGSVSVTNAGNATGKTGLMAQAVGVGNITIENDGQITGTSFSGINVIQNATGAVGSTTITNTGTVIGTGSSSAINVNENATGTVTINNSGIVGPAVINSSTNGIGVNGGSQVTINNTGHINGHIVTGSNGVVAGDTTINNQAGSVWQTSFVTNEGTIVATGSTISVTQSGNGMVVGNTGNAHLTLQAGAVMTADFLNVAQQVGSVGTVLVTGAGTTVNTTVGQFQNIMLGQDGTASLTIADQAVVNTTNMGMAVDHQNGVTDSLVIDHAALNVAQGLTIGFSGAANATVQDGGSLSANYIGLAQQAGSSADLTVTGAGSSASTSFMQINNGATLHVGTGGTVTVNGMDDEGAIFVSGGTLDVKGQLTGAGTITLSSGANLILESSTTFAPITVASTGSTVTVSVDNDVLIVPGDGNMISETGNNESLTLNGNNDTVSLTGNGGTIKVAGGNAAITLSSASDQANVTSAIAGAIGISVVQNGAGDVNISAPNAVTGQSGHGILAEENASGVGNIVVNATGSVAGTGSGADGILAMNLDAANGGNVTVTATGASGTQNAIQASTNGTGTVSVHAGGNITATGQATAGQGQYGIRALNDGTGSVSVVTDVGTVINSGGEGVGATNRDLNIPLAANASVTATVNGTINFGSVPNPSGSAAKGIDVGFYAGGNGNPNVNGTVLVNNFANVTETVGNQGYAVSAYNYGDGSVTLNEGAGTVVSAGQIGIGAFGNSASTSFTGGANDVTINVADNASITGLASFGLQAYDSGVGNVSVTTGNGDIINGGSDGIVATDSAKSISAGHTITVNVGADTVHSSTRYGINAGYNPANAGNTVNGNVHGDVFLTSNATVTSVNNAVNGFNWGTGNVTVVTGSASSETSSGGSGIFAGAFDGGSVFVTNGGNATGMTGLMAQAVGAGNITIENDGHVTGTSFSGINVVQNAAGAVGSTTIVNTGTVVATAANHSAINVSENATGTVTITNSGTIGSAATSSNPAITENGGTVVVNNNGTIIGNIFTANPGLFTGTMNNNAGASWQTGFIDDEGTINASGAGSSIAVAGSTIGMVVGNSATGALTIAADAMLTAGFLNIGSLAGSHGTVTVTGSGTTVNAGANIGLGLDGTASLSVADHAAVTTTNMDVAFHNDAGVVDTLDVNNASLNIGSGLTIGDAGTAHATVENGGAITANSINLASQLGSVGSLSVDGAGSLVSTVGLGLGLGSANLSVTHGGAIDIGSGTTTVAGAIHVGSSASLSGAGTINADIVNDGNVTVTTAGSGTLDINGVATGSGSFAINAGGHLEFGSSVAATNNVSFQTQTGSLILDHSSGFAASIIGFTGDGTLANSDEIDLKDINFNSGSFTESFDQASDTITMSDGTNSATLHFVGSYVAENFKFSSDGGSGTLLIDPPVPSGVHGSSDGAHSQNTSGPPSGAGSTHGDGFNFANLGPVDPVGFHPHDLPHSGDQGLASWLASEHQQAHAENPGAPHDVHDHVGPHPIVQVENNFGHFHLV
jgi:T5SS/PEP-CTERM-associated repeat protein